MHTSPKPIDHLKRNILSILALGLGLLVGYGFGASRSNYAIVYAPAPSASGIVGSAATTPNASPAAAQTASVVFFPSRPAAAVAATAPMRAEAPALAPARKPAETRLTAGLAAVETTSHERSAAFIAKSAETKPAVPAPAQKPITPSVERALESPSIPPVHAVAAETGSIRYGAATRGEIMGRGAGPVYNFGASGSKSAAGAQTDGGANTSTSIDATIQNAANVIDATEQQLEKAPLSPEMRQQLTTSLKASKAGVQQVAAGQPGQ